MLSEILPPFHLIKLNFAPTTGSAYTHLLLLSIFFFILFAFETVYFKIADKYNIIDHPNERSSHHKITIRGGGINFLLANICAVIIHPGYWLPVSGILIIGIISFMDDIFTLSGKIRLLFHLIAVTILFFLLKCFSKFN